MKELIMTSITTFLIWWCFFVVTFACGVQFDKLGFKIAAKQAFVAATCVLGLIAAMLSPVVTCYFVLQHYGVI